MYKGRTNTVAVLLYIQYHDRVNIIEISDNTGHSVMILQRFIKNLQQVEKSGKQMAIYII